MKRTLYTLILGVLALSSYADIRNGWAFWGAPINSFTFSLVDGAVTELLLPDSTVIDVDTLDVKRSTGFFFIVDGTQKEYILRLSHPDYETTYKNLTLALRKRERTIEIGNVPMRRLTMAEKGITLDEVEIVTSKVQFYHKGDTIVYDATAFQIAEGSMLDALIEQLPGAEINEDGQIYVNGRFVESLLLNGEEFFNGKQEIMLQNLPAYTVKSLNVYEKESEESRRLGYKVDEGTYVMDVKLKREYNVGWLANTELGGGTKERYAGRAFALRFSDLSRVSAFANLNNLNDNRKPGQNGNWQPSDLSGGLMESQTGGLDYVVNGQKNSYKLQGNVFVTHTDKDIRRTSSSTTFLPDGDVYGYGRNSQDNENFSISTWHKWQFFGSDNRYNSYIDSYVSPSVNYSRSNSLYNNANAAFLDNYLQSPELLDSLLNGEVEPMRPFVNRLNQAQKSTGSNLNGQLQGFFHFEIPHTDDAVSISATASYNDRKNRQFDKYILEYPTATSDVRDRYFDMPYKGYNFNGEVNITFHHMEKDNQAPTLASESPTNKRYLQYVSVLDGMTSPLKREADSLKNIGRWYTPRMMELEAQFHTACNKQARLKFAQEATELRESGEAFTPEYYAFQTKSRRVREERDKYIEDYMRNDRSVIGLNLLRHQALRSRNTSRDLELTTIYNEIYQPLFPNHPLSKQIEEWIQSLGIKVGNRYIDFTAPALDGTQHTLSKEIGGKIALIDLWASWCGSCRGTSKSMIPLYEKYKERGFTVVGVAREDKRENMERALAKDGYPWLNLLELRDENEIWSKYGVDYAGGTTVLVDRDGTILAIHPTIEELERILKEQLE